MLKELNEDISGYNYMVKNYANYGMKTLKTPKDMIWLLNVLQANGENFESMHDYVTQGDGFFCAILISDNNSMDSVYEALTNYHYFYEDYEDMKKTVWNNLLENDGEELYEFYKDFEEYMEKGGDSFFKTKDGYVRKIYY